MEHGKNYAIHSGWLIPTIKAIEYINLNYDEVLNACEINIDLLIKNEALCVESMCKIMDYCNKKTNRVDFAIIVAEHFHVGMFHALGYSMMSSDSLSDAFHRLYRYRKLVSNTTDISLLQHSNSYCLRLEKMYYPDTLRQMLSNDWLLCFMATIVQFARQATLRGISPTKVCLEWAKPEGDLSWLTDYFKCEILFDQPEMSLHFDQVEFEQQLLGRNPFLVLSHDKILDKYINDIQKSDVVKQSMRFIRELLPLGTPSQTCIANKLGISLRSLQRKLQAHDTTYRDLLELTRKELALNYITQVNISFCEIGYLVGFSSTSNFNRAFKRWTDLTPSSYRKAYLKH